MSRSKILRFCTYIFASISFAFLAWLVLYILFYGTPYLSWKLFELPYSSQNVSMMPAIITTVELVALTLLIAVPLGVFAGFYLVEYAGKNNRWVKVFRLATSTLAGVPSIVFGLFGMLAFVITAHMQYSLLAGVLTLTIMILPLIIRNTEEALIAVDPRLRQASFGLGAGKLRTIFRVILPVAMPGILSGIILGIGRIVGETAALMYTLGTAPSIPKHVLSQGRSLALHMYILSTEGLHRNEAMATGVILLIVILIVNAVSSWLANKMRTIGGN